VVRRFNEEMNAAVKAPEVVDRLRKAYAFPESTTPEAFTKFLADEGARWTKLIKETNIKAD
jgi:tripartite-type tricarboxylate transporter receptor subunit TctC